MPVYPKEENIRPTSDASCSWEGGLSQSRKMPGKGKNSVSGPPAGQEEGSYFYNLCPTTSASSSERPWNLQWWSCLLLARKSSTALCLTVSLKAMKSKSGVVHEGWSSQTQGRAQQKEVQGQNYGQIRMPLLRGELSADYCSVVSRACGLYLASAREDATLTTIQDASHNMLNLASWVCQHHALGCMLCHLYRP